ncbi:alpha/beta-hydrolase [Laetiporus sulphureus 93-53]|uniref:Alpha/beta-hydrolase n=1 Tax=Laetiporus sulphureus 93-53 TaxID=1314785 RepID=A0A165DCZ1_9APHY|nr:alpha/beta-hydrolase [Laetiporus sulphureus 93-53]KZT04597.1 alpha/beta-hydrolase [Laetiporus sulphureus 93-53]
MKTVKPYGTWDSPVSIDLILQAGDAKISDDVFVDPVTSKIYHTEGRPDENGRDTIIASEEGIDVLGKPWDARDGIYEYGGAPAVAFNGTLYFSNYTDGRVYKTTEGGQPESITPDSNNVVRYANFSVHPKQNHLIVAVLEDHKDPEPSNVINNVCLINANTRTVSTIVSDADFYASPTFSPDGAHIAWVQWNFPDMPFDGSQLYVGDVTVSADETSLSVSNATYVAGKASTVSATFACWASNDVVLFTSDESGFINPWMYSVSSHKAGPILSKPIKDDFGVGKWTLSWNFGAAMDLEAKKSLFISMREGRSVIYVVDVARGTANCLDCPYVNITTFKRAGDNRAVFLGQKRDNSANVILCTLEGSDEQPELSYKELKNSTEIPDDVKASISYAQPITLENDAGEALYVIYYPPTNVDYTGPEDERPPCVVDAHGGPTGIAYQSLQWLVQYFTSRGFAWMDVNYSGSSGYGRAYVNRLLGQWGVLDVKDIVSAIKQISSAPRLLVDPKRTAIRGESSGGYDALMTICSHPDAYTAATSQYGIADLTTLAQHTHKFESRYIDELVGGTWNDNPQLYDSRSPVNLASSIKTPLLVLQGLADNVVPPEQAQAIVVAIMKQGGTVESITFPGEGHGWRKAETIKKAYESELGFYRVVWGLFP